MKTLPYLAAALVLTAPLAHAQETTAAGSLNAEASWNALKILAENAQGTAKTAQITANAALDKATKLETCTKQQAFYAPDVQGSTPKDGCVAASGGTRWITEGTLYTNSSFKTYIAHYQSALKAAGVTRACNAQVGSYPQGNSNISSQKFASVTSTNEISGQPCSKHNDRCYQLSIAPDKTINTASILICK